MPTDSTNPRLVQVTETLIVNLAHVWSISWEAGGLAVDQQTKKTANVADKIRIRFNEDSSEVIEGENLRGCWEALRAHSKPAE